MIRALVTQITKTLTGIREDIRPCQHRWPVGHGDARCILRGQHRHHITNAGSAWIVVGEEVATLDDNGPRTFPISTIRRHRFDQV